jgi:hypothetical protein
MLYRILLGIVLFLNMLNASAENEKVSEQVQVILKGPEICYNATAVKVGDILLLEKMSTDIPCTAIPMYPLRTTVGNAGMPPGQCLFTISRNLSAIDKRSLDVDHPVRIWAPCLKR